MPPVHCKCTFIIQKAWKQPQQYQTKTPSKLHFLPWNYFNHQASWQVDHSSTGSLYSCQNEWSKNMKNLFTSTLQVVITRTHELGLMGGCPSWLVACLHNSNEMWLFHALECAVTPSSLVVWHMMRLMLRRCQKSEHMQGDNVAARGGIICLSSCHHWSVIRKGSEMWQHGHQMTGIYLSAPELPYETAQPRCAARDTKKLAEKSFINDIFFNLNLISGL